MIDLHRLSFGAADQGQALPPYLRQRMELLFGTSFADVRVHLDDVPRTLGAAAFAHGSDIYITPDEYDPDSPDGWALLGHELAHVRQSQRGWSLAPEGLGVRLLVDSVLEAEAARMSALARRAFGPETTLPVSRPTAAGPHRWDLLLT